MRLYLYKARAFPLFARFVVQTGLHLDLIYEYVPQHLEAGFASGRFHRMPMEVAMDLIGGQALMAIARLEAGDAAEDYPEWVVATLLRALGVPQKDAQRIAFAPLEPVAMPEDSLLARATARAVGQDQ